MSNYFDHLLSLDGHTDSHTDSQALRAEYCIVGIPHNTAIYSSKCVELFFDCRVSRRLTVALQAIYKNYNTSFGCMEGQANISGSLQLLITASRATIRSPPMYLTGSTHLLATEHSPLVSAEPILSGQLSFVVYHKEASLDRCCLFSIIKTKTGFSFS